MHNAKYKVPPEDVKRARQLRQNMSLAEKLIWYRLRQIPQELAITFRRQQAIHPYIVDFICLKHRLIIELDGCSHDARQSQDAARDQYLKRKNYTVLRFSNDEALKNPDAIVATILAYFAENCLSGRPEKLSP